MKEIKLFNGVKLTIDLNSEAENDIARRFTEILQKINNPYTTDCLTEDEYYTAISSSIGKQLITISILADYNQSYKELNDNLANVEQESMSYVSLEELYGKLYQKNEE